MLGVHFRLPTGQHPSRGGNIHGAVRRRNYGNLSNTYIGFRIRVEQKIFCRQGTFFILAVSNGESPGVFERLN